MSRTKINDRNEKDKSSSINKNKRISEFVSEIEQDLPIWESDYIIIEELFRPLIEAIISVIKQDDKARPTNLAIIGNTNTGKTEFLNNFIPEISNVLKLPNQYGIVQIKLTTYTSLYGLYHAILDQLNWTYRRSDKISHLERLIGIACKERGCKLIVIDEFNQLSRGTISDQHQTEILESLRNLPNQTLRPLLITGTNSVDNLLLREYQSDNRFDKMYFPRLRLTKSDGQVCRRLLANLEEKLFQDHGITSELNSDVYLIERLYQISNGKIGALIQTFEKSVSYTLKQKSTKLDGSHLEAAIEYLEENRRFSDKEDNYIAEIEEEWYNGV